MSKFSADRYHDISCGHRVSGHESKCQHLHGHNYRIHFKVEAELDDVGRVLDFSVIKTRLCLWLEDNWDHKFLAWEKDPIMTNIHHLICTQACIEEDRAFNASMVWTPFNPTAENMAQYLLEVVGPQQLKGTGCKLVQVIVEETRKCSASFSI